MASISAACGDDGDAGGDGATTDATSADGGDTHGTDTNGDSQTGGGSGSTGDTGTGATSTGTGATDTETTSDPVCGNLIVETGEACDDGNDDPSDTCTAECETTGLQLWYQLEDDLQNSGLAEGHEGSAFDHEFMDGVIGRAIKFLGDTGGGMTLIQSKEVLSADYEYTIGMWFREPEAQTGSKFLWHNSTSEGGFRVETGGAGKLTFCANLGSGTECNVTIDYGAVGTWHHLLIRHAGSSTDPGGGADLQIYIDGTLVDTYTNPTGHVIFSDKQGGADIGINGTVYHVDEVKIYNTVMTAEEHCEKVIAGTWEGGGCTLP